MPPRRRCQDIGWWLSVGLPVLGGVAAIAAIVQFSLAPLRQSVRALKDDHFARLERDVTKGVHGLRQDVLGTGDPAVGNVRDLTWPTALPRPGHAVGRRGAHGHAADFRVSEGRPSPPAPLWWAKRP